MELSRSTCQFARPAVGKYEVLQGVDTLNLVVRREGTQPATTVAGHLRAVTLSRSEGQTLGMKLRYALMLNCSSYSPHGTRQHGRW